VVVGISAYAKECQGADRDAEAFTQMLTGELGPLPPDGAVGNGAGEDTFGRWAPEKNIHKLVNGRATRSAIEEALTAIRTRAATQDRVVFYFAGRGTRLKGKRGLAGLALQPYGGAGEALSLEDLAKRVRAVPARRRLVILDVDFNAGPRGSGPSARAPKGLDAALREAFLADASGGAVVLASSLGQGERAQAYEGEGLLTHYLVRGLRGAADVGADGLTYGDLDAYLTRHVLNLSEVALPNPQRPRVVSLSPRDPLR
jgi:hypothetical protein